MANPATHAGCVVTVAGDAVATTFASTWPLGAPGDLTSATY